MKFLTKITGPLKKFWGQIDPKDRRLIRLYLLISNVVLVFALIILFYLSPRVPESEEFNNSSSSQLSLASDSTTNNQELKDSSRVLSDSNQTQLDSTPIANTGYAQSDSIDIYAHSVLAKQFTTQGKYTKSLPHLKRLVEQEPANHQLLFQLGETWLKAGFPDSALTPLQEAKKLNSANAKYMLRLNEALFYSGKVKNALQSLEVLAQNNPDDAEIQTTSALLAALAFPNNSGHEEVFNTLKQKFPETPKVWISSGQYQAERGNFNLAELDLKKAEKLDPLNPHVYSTKGYIAFRNNQIDQAEVDFKTTLSLQPDDYNTWYNLGEVYGRKSYLADSPNEMKRYNHLGLDSYLKTLSINQNHSLAHFRVGVLLLNNLQAKEAIHHFYTALEKDSQNSQILLPLATAYELIKNDLKALEIIELAYKAEPLNKVIAQKRKLLSKKVSISKAP